MEDHRGGPRMGSYQGKSNLGISLRLVYMEQSGLSLAVLLPGKGLPRIVHWGDPVADPQALLGTYDALAPQRVSGGLDLTAWPSILPTQSEAWTGQHRLRISRGGVEVFCCFQVESVDLGTEPIRPDDSAVPTLKVQACDRDQGVGLTWHCQVLSSGLVRQRADLLNLDTARDLDVNGLELAFPLPTEATEILTTTGHHLRERSPQRQPLTVGLLERPSLVGRPDFDSSLVMCAGRPGFGFEHDEVYAVHLGWSGNGLLSAERIPSAPALLGGGEILMAGEVTLPPADGHSGRQAYSTPWLYGSRGKGLDQAAHRYHAFLRSLHPGLASRPRPVTLNTWEAVYFDQSYDKLAALADQAARIGVERFVVDDGWFQGRRSDESGLGDWSIDRQVWPEGPKSLEALAARVHQLGMEFGLWFEPEMICPDSNVFRPGLPGCL